MLRALETQFDVVLVVREPWPSWFTFLRRAVRRLSGGIVDLYWSRFMSKTAASRTLSAVEKSGISAVQPFGAALNTW